MKSVLIGLAFIPVFVTTTTADVRLPALFGDGMVLQRNQPVPIWGWAEPGERVTVSFDEQEVRTRAGEDGRWEVRLKALEADEPRELTVRGKDTIRIKNVLVGEVWLCAGQSNMAMRVRQVQFGLTEIAAGDHPQIRMFTVNRRAAEKPMNDPEGEWLVCSPETVGDYSATAYFFGRALHRDLDIPVGLINASWGATRIEAWTRLATQDTVAEIEPILSDWAHKAKVKREREHRNWKRRVEAAAAEDKPIPLEPSSELPLKPLDPPPGTLFNGLIAPLIPYAFRGVIWYQGEANTEGAFTHLYGVQLRTLIADWRDVWQRPDLPFLFVQLPDVSGLQVEPVEPTGWVFVREGMLQTLAVPGTGMAVTIDIGEVNSVHPANKQDVGARLALWALATVYGRDIVYSGPIYRSMRRKGDKIVIDFDHVGTGLVALAGDSLMGFAVAGENHEFVWAEARIVGDEVEVWSPYVSHPLAVRYAWAINPIGNLINKEGLPASPFRTDSW